MSYLNGIAGTNHVRVLERPGTDFTMLIWTSIGMEVDIPLT